MTNKPHQKSVEAKMDPWVITHERNQYFTGKYMTARDFRAEQDYFLSHQRSHIRMLHGWGVLCGLGIQLHWNDDCKNHWLKVMPGVAFDCYGREIDVKNREYVWLPMPSEKPKDASADTQYDPKKDQEANNHLNDKDGNAIYDTIYSEAFLLCLQYSETCIDQVTALTSDNCNPAHKENNRVREGYKFTFIKFDGFDESYWKRTQDQQSGTSNPDECEHCDDCPPDDDDEDTQPRTCLDADCKYEGFVPIALITPHLDKNGFLQTPGFDFQIKGRKAMPVPSDDLTHIAGINWPHGGKMRLSELHARHGRLEVRFDRRLWRPVEEDEGEIIAVGGADIDRDGNIDVGVIIREYDDPIDTGLGINQDTFIVQSRSNELEGDGDFVSQFVPYAERTPPNIEGENDNLAVYMINMKKLSGQSNLGGKKIHITLRCDFILDCHERPVDGNFLGASFPTGDGVKGGTFESWFYVVDDWEDPYKRRGKNRQQGGKS